jgi:hypothetical protein
MSLMIAIPSYDGKIHYDTMRGVVQTTLACAKSGIGIAVDVRPHDAFIGKARSIMCEQFLERGFHDLLFVDSDVGFGVEEVVKICQAKADIAMGLYRLKQDGPEETKMVKYPALMVDPIERHEEDPFLIKLVYGPAGFLRIRRPVLEAMMEKWPTEWWTDDKGKVHDFFPAGRAGNYFNGEDIAFCNRARECGFDVYGVQGLNLRHYGEKRWPSTWQIDIPVMEETSENDAVSREGISSRESLRHGDEQAGPVHRDSPVRVGGQPGEAAHHAG